MRHNQKKAARWGGFFVYGGGPGIRTPGTSRFNGFQDRRFRPLSQPTETVSRLPPNKSAHYIAALYAIKLLRYGQCSFRSTRVVTGSWNILLNDADRRNFGSRKKLRLLGYGLRFRNWLG